MTIPAPANQVVVFNYADWASLYPELAVSVQPGPAQTYFNQATLYCDNTPTSVIQDPFTLTTCLYMLTAHIAKLYAILGGQQPSGLVGQVISASEGSVSVGTVTLTPTSDMQAWLNQTSYGIGYWAATLQYRTGFYVSPLRPRSFRQIGACSYGRLPWLR